MFREWLVNQAKHNKTSLGPKWEWCEKLSEECNYTESYQSSRKYLSKKGGGMSINVACLPVNYLFISSCKHTLPQTFSKATVPGK